MKYYIRQIKPYAQLTIPGVDAGFAIDGYDWVPEDMEDSLRKKIVLEDPLLILTFKEKFVEVQNV